MRRAQLLLEDKQHEALRLEAKEKDISTSELVRQILDDRKTPTSNEEITVQKEPEATENEEAITQEEEIQENKEPEKKEPSPVEDTARKEMPSLEDWIEVYNGFLALIDALEHDLVVFNKMLAKPPVKEEKPVNEEKPKTLLLKPLPKPTTSEEFEKQMNAIKPGTYTKWFHE